MAMTLTVLKDRDEQTERLADAVAAQLREAVGARGRASLAVPGGTTPGPFLTRLGRADLPWDKVTVTLTDERCVPADHPRSNRRLVAATLLTAAAGAASFLSLFDADVAPEASLASATAALADGVLPLDVCVLGMGDDMHTASLFPGAEGLAEALNPPKGEVLLPIRAPADGELRVTLTGPVLRAAGQIHLLIQGPAKMRALDRARVSAQVEEAPVRTVLDRAGPTTVWYAD